MSRLGDEVVERAKSQLGVRYYSMHEGPKGSGDEGWGCAMLAMWCHNAVLGTSYYGSCYNIFGDAIGDAVYNEGGGQFVLVSDPQPGDVVLYSPFANMTSATHCGHAAIYVGDGMVIGACGRGTPWDSDYRNYGVLRTTVQWQTLGGDIRYARCTRTLADPVPDVGQDEMGDPTRMWYKAHVQDVGWQGWVRGGGIAGTTGKSLRMEALRLHMPDGVTADVTVHIEDVGDKTYRNVTDKTVIGTTGKALRLEGICIDVTANEGTRTKGRKLKYRAHLQNRGWTKWVSAGRFCGTRGKSLRMEAIQLKWVKP